LLHRLDDLLPSTHERAKGIAQGHIVSLGIELLREGGISFIKVFGVKGHVILLEVSAFLISEPEKFCTFISDPDWRPHQVKTFGKKRQPPPMGLASSEHALNEGQLTTQSCRSLEQPRSYLSDFGRYEKRASTLRTWMARH
jgi:hypothetical protein